MSDSDRLLPGELFRTNVPVQLYDDASCRYPRPGITFASSTIGLVLTTATKINKPITENEKSFFVLIDGQVGWLWDADLGRIRRVQK